VKTQTNLIFRVIAFALLAPCIGVTLVLALVVLAADGALADLPGTIARFERSVGIFLVIGVPIAVFVEVVVGLPAFFLLRRHNRFGLASVLTTAGLAGGLGFALPMSLMPGFSQLSAILSTIAIGAAGGVSAGVVLWAGVLRDFRAGAQKVNQ
jgi:hypothetical protein